MKISKHEFASEAECNTLITALGVSTDDDGNQYPTHKHSITKLGNIVFEQGEWDSAGNETKAPVLSDKFHVDVCWDLSDTYNDDGELVKAELPSGWASSNLDISDNGVHMFAGLNYTEYKFL